MQRNQRNQRNIVNNVSAGVVVGACGAAKHVALYASEMHELPACI